MPGLNLGLGGSLGLGGAQSAPASTVTVAQTAYGAGGTPVSSSSGLHLWHVGAIGIPTVCIVALVFLRWSLPR